jgi:hypothetical protein
VTNQRHPVYIDRLVKEEHVAYETVYSMEEYLESSRMVLYA